MIAGSKGQIDFSPKAMALIHEYSLGIPRMINLICDRALLGAYTLQTTNITKEIVEKAVENLKLRRKEPKMTLPGEAPAGPQRVRTPIIIPAIVIGAGALGFLIYQNIQGLEGTRAKRALERQLAQVKIGRQIEKSRLEQEITKLQKDIGTLKARPTTPPATPPVIIPDEWKDSFTIFLGVFDDRKSAIEKAKGLRGVKQKAHVVAIGTEGGSRKYYLVLGNFKDKGKATNVLDELQIQGELLDAEVMAFTEVLSAE